MPRSTATGGHEGFPNFSCPSSDNSPIQEYNYYNWLLNESPINV